MTYFHYRPDADNFAGIGLDPDDEQQVVDAYYSDKRLKSGWAVPKAFGFSDNPAQNGDFPSLCNFWRFPVMTEAAWNALSATIGNNCEALPIWHPSGIPHCAIHIVNPLDALDHMRSKVSRSAVDGRISRIHKYVFKQDMVRDSHMFRLPIECGGELIIDTIFKKAVEERGLKGLTFNSLP